MILIDAVYICQSGGKNLLDLLINQIEKDNKTEEVLFLIDNRIKDSYSDHSFYKVKFQFLKGSELSRYVFYIKNKNIFRKVLCFANVPPPIRLNCPVYTYFQNVILFDKVLQVNFSLKNRILLVLKGSIINNRLKNCDKWIVQTDHVKDLLIRYSKIQVNNIEIFPFFNDDKVESVNQKEFSFFYPATGAQHKNHSRLLKAWHNLFKKGLLTNELHLTIENNEKNSIYAQIASYKKMGIPIINHGYISMHEVNKLYARCKYVIHPSLGESFGLVLIEALKNNCILIAPDLSYVNAIVQSNYSFNPLSIKSIEEAVKHAIDDNMGKQSKILIKNETKNFINFLTK